MKDKIVIAVDVDGTIMEHKFPYDGADIPNCIKVLKALTAKGHKIVINTMRDKIPMKRAMEWFITNSIPLYGANKNPTQSHWTSSSKTYAHMYIDDAALGIPLINHGTLNDDFILTFDAQSLDDDIQIFKGTSVLIIDPELNRNNRNQEVYIKINDQYRVCTIPNENIERQKDSRDFVDWFRVEEMLKKLNVL